MVIMAATANKPTAGNVNPLAGRRNRVSAALLLGMLVTTPTAYALDWRFEPRIGAFARVTDNVNQRASDPQSALILGVTPGFSLQSVGSRRVQASLQYGLSGVTRFGGDGKNDLLHRLDAIGKTELVEDLLYLDGSARISQELISLLGSTADASTNSSNRVNVGTYQVSPYIKKRLGSFASTELRYTASGVIFGNSASMPNANVNALSARLVSGPRFNDLSWALDYSLRKMDNRNFSSTTFERMSAQLGYALTRKFRVFGTVGQDSNDYLSSTSTDGSSYSVGFGWAPSQRTNVQASGGKRYFGTTYSLAVNHRTRQSRWNIRYSEDVSDFAQLATTMQNALLTSCPVDAVLPAEPTVFDAINAGCTRDVLLGTSVSNGVFISKVLSGGVTWDMSRKTSVSATVSDLLREYQIFGQGEDRVRSATGSINHRLTPRTTAIGSLSLTRNSVNNAAIASREDDILGLSLGLDHRFAKDFTGALIFRHLQRDSNAANASYDENSLSATATMRF